MGTLRHSTVLSLLLLTLVPYSLHAHDRSDKPTFRKRPSPALAPVKKTPPVSFPRPVVSSPTRRSPFLRPGEYLSPDQLHGGMTGYGLTVFHGNTIEKFSVTVLGVVKKANNGRDLILVKLGGPTLRRVSDIIAGMSGSPVYINGKIIGAVAYGASFTRESIGYVTPIEDMLEAWEPHLPQRQDDDPAPAPEATLPTPLTLDDRVYRRVQIAQAPVTREKRGTLTLRPLTTKVTVSGVSGRGFAELRRALADFGLEARQGGGGSADAALKGSPLTPGGAIAMSLATGDIDITGIGTLTYRQGNRVVAFGHPFLGIGPVEAAMYSAYIHDIEPSFAESSKIGSPIQLVGTFSQDRPYSISGQIGAKPEMLPLTITVHDRMLGRERTFNARLLKHPALVNRLVNIAAAAAIGEVHNQLGEATALVTTRVQTDGYGTIVRTNRVQDGSAIETAAGEDLKNAMGMLTNNPYGRVGVRSVRMEVDISPGKQTAAVERIFLKQSRYEPGDTVEIGVVVRPYKQPEQVKTLRLTLPPTLPPGTHTLTVQGGASGFSSSGLLAMFLGRGPDFSNTTSIAQMIRRYNERERNDALVARLVLPTSSLSVKGEKLEGLPPNIENTMRMNAVRSSGTRIERDETKVTEPTEWVLNGTQSLTIRVVGKGQSDVSPLPIGSGTSGEPSGSGSSSASAGAAGLTPQSAFSEDGYRMALAGSLTLDAPPESPIKAGPPATGPTAPTAPVGVVTPTSETAPSPVTLVGRQPGIWRQAGIADFRTGTREGIALGSDGTLRLAAKLSRIADTTEPYFWCVVPDGKGGVFAGSGDSGKVYHTDAAGGCRVFAATGELEVHSLVRLADGTLFAGTAPHGIVFRIRPDGVCERVFQATAKYITALSLSRSGDTLYVAAGGPRARVYALPVVGAGAASEIYSSDEGSVTALSIAPDGGLIAGTSTNGLILRLTDGSGAALRLPQVLFDAAESTICGLAVDGAGTIFAATAPRGVLYRIAAGEAPRMLLERAPANVLAGLCLSVTGDIYTASGSTVLAISPVMGSVRSIEAPTDLQVVNLCLDGEGRLWAATGGVGGVSAMPVGAVPREGTYLSPVFDARSVAQWGTLRTIGSAPRGSQVSVQTRSGNSVTPDSSWSDWSGDLTALSGEAILSAPARYLQYRLRLRADADSADQVAIRSVEAFYLPPNQAPVIALQSPRPGEVWRGTKTVRWTGSDPDRDALAYEVFVSGDGGITWKKQEALKPVTVPVSSTSVAKVTSANPVQAELDKHPEISPEMRARILADAPKPAPSAVATRTGDSATSHDTSLSLNTMQLADGTYLLKVIASDKQANPTNGLSTEAVSGPFVVVNRSPVVTLSEKELSVSGSKPVKLTGVALQKLAIVRGVQYRVDAGEWQSAAAGDGIFDSQSESFTLETAPLSAGKHVIEVQAVDEAGNSVTERVTVTVTP